MRRRLIVLVLLGAIAACETARTEGSEPDSRKPETDEQARTPEPEPLGDPNTCMPPGLEAASKVESVALPAGCRITSAGVVLAPTVIRSESELAAAIECEPGSSPPTIDFARHQLHVGIVALPPAYAGGELFDDGKLVTYVQRHRSPCPDDPRPMPMNSTIAYLLPHGAERSYGQLACPLPAKCE